MRALPVRLRHARSSRILEDAFVFWVRCMLPTQGILLRSSATCRSCAPCFGRLLARRTLHIANGKPTVVQVSAGQHPACEESTAE
jgi:hypothetical protein